MHLVSVSPGRQKPNSRENYFNELKQNVLSICDSQSHSLTRCTRLARGLHTTSTEYGELIEIVAQRISWNINSSLLHQKPYRSLTELCAANLELVPKLECLLGALAATTDGAAPIRTTLYRIISKALSTGEALNYVENVLQRGRLIETALEDGEYEALKPIFQVFLETSTQQDAIHKHTMPILAAHYEKEVNKIIKTDDPAACCADLLSCIEKEIVKLKMFLKETLPIVNVEPYMSTLMAAFVVKNKAVFLSCLSELIEAKAHPQLQAIHRYFLESGCKAELDLGLKNVVQERCIKIYMEGLGVTLSYDEFYVSQISVSPDSSAGIMVPLIDYIESVNELIQKIWGPGDKSISQEMRMAWEYVFNGNKSLGHLTCYLLAGHLNDALADPLASDTERSRVVESCLNIFRKLDSKEIFRTTYQNDLTARSLYGKIQSISSEHEILRALRNECGHSFTSKLENMLREWETAKEVWTDNTIEQSIEKFECYLISSLIWSNIVPEKTIFPSVIEKFMESYASAHRKKQADRHITWTSQYGYATIKATFTRTYSLRVSQQTAICLLLFNSNLELTASDVESSCLLSAEAAENNLALLSRRNILDKAEVYTVNELFECESKQISLWNGRNFDQAHSSIDNAAPDLGYVLDARIARILKLEKEMMRGKLYFCVKKDKLKSVTNEMIDARLMLLVQKGGW